VRLNSDVPLEISLVELRPSNGAGCFEMFSPTFHFSVHKDPSFISERWYPKAGAWAGGRILHVCHAASRELLVVAWIRYGASEVGEKDAMLIRGVLDHVAESADRGPHTTGQVSESVADFFSACAAPQGVMGGIGGGVPPHAVANGTIAVTTSPNPAHVSDEISDNSSPAPAADQRPLSPGYDPWLFLTGLTRDTFKSSGLADLSPERRAAIYDSLKRQRFTLQCGRKFTAQSASSFDEIWVKLDFARGVPDAYKSKLRELLSSLPEIRLIEQTLEADLVVASQVDENMMHGNRAQRVIAMNLFQPCFYSADGADPTNSQTVRSFLAIRLIGSASLKEAAKYVESVLNNAAFPRIRERHKLEVAKANKIASAEAAIHPYSSNSADNSSLSDTESRILRVLLDRIQPVFRCGKTYTSKASAELSVRLNYPKQNDASLNAFLTELNGSIADLRSFGLAPEGQDPDYNLEVVGTYWTTPNSLNPMLSNGPSAYTVGMAVVEPCEFHDPVLPAQDVKLGNLLLTLVESRNSGKDTARKIAEKFQKDLLQLRRKSSDHL